MSKHSYDQEHAFDALRDESQHANAKLRHVAQGIIAAAIDPSP